MAAAAYILRIPHARREFLLEYDITLNIAEPVPKFDHSKRAPLIVLACFDDKAITHVADGRKGASAGTGLVRLNMTSLQQLRRPIRFEELIDRALARLRSHLARYLAAGGKLPPKTLGATVDILIGLDPDLSGRLARFSDLRAARLAGLTPTVRDNLAIQKETVSAALQIAGIGTEEVLNWSLAETPPRSFLEGLPEARVREDAMLATDFSVLPGFEAIRTHPFAAREFRGSENPDLRLTVIMANRLPLEEQTGADLIYYNETFHCFIFVQYKAMEDGSHGPEFRWNLKDNLIDEINHMDTLLRELRKFQTPNSRQLSSSQQSLFFETMPAYCF